MQLYLQDMKMTYWCPPDNCQIYTNPYGYVGATSSFNLCYNPDTDEITKGVWTGSLTDVSMSIFNV